MHTADENIIRNNERFWLEMTKRGTLRYCHEMLKLSPEFQKARKDNVNYEEHLKSIDDEILAYMDLVNEQNKKGCLNDVTAKDSPFPKDLHGYIHENYEQEISGAFQTNHLMCKLAVLRDEINHVYYEFLIEYDIFETDVEIYFGVKAISDSWETTPAFQEIVLNQWKEVERKGSYKRNKHRFKITNNGNNGTFWPFWWRMGMDCREELLDTIEIIKKFYKDYKRVLGLREVVTPIFNRVSVEVVNSLLSEKDYDNLIEKISKEFDSSISALFEDLLNRCVDNNILKEGTGPGKVFLCSEKVVTVVCLIREFFLKVSCYNKEWKDNKNPVDALSRVILDKHGRVINLSNWRKDREQISEQQFNHVQDILLEWFPLLK